MFKGYYTLMGYLNSWYQLLFQFGQLNNYYHSINVINSNLLCQYKCCQPMAIESEMICACAANGCSRLGTVAVLC